MIRQKAQRILYSTRILPCCAYDITSPSKTQVLSFDRSQQRSLGEILLQEGIHDDDGKGADADDRVFNRVGRYLGILGLAFRTRESAHGQDDDLPKPYLNGPVIDIIQIHHGVEIAVPVGYGIEQSDRGEGRLGNRHHDPQKDLQVIAAVNLCRFLDAVRESLEEVLHDHHVVGADRDGQPERPVGI